MEFRSQSYNIFLEIPNVSAFLFQGVIALLRLKVFAYYFVYWYFCCNLAAVIKNIRDMTTLAKRIKETPMAPYLGVLDGMTREQKLIVVTYITESMEEPKPKRRQVSAEFKKLRGMVNITNEEISQDEHLAHIMGR